MADPRNEAVLTQKVNAALEAGALPWEVEAAMSHGTADQRRIVSNAIRVAHVGRPLNDEQATDFAEIANLGSSEPISPQELSMLSNGQRPPSVEDMVNKYRHSLGMQQVADVLPDMPPSIAASIIQQEFLDEDSAIRSAAWEATRTSPTPLLDEYILELESMHAEQRQLKARYEEIARQRAEEELIMLDAPRLVRERDQESTLATIPGPVGAVSRFFRGTVNQDLFWQAPLEFTPRTTIDLVSKTNALIEAGLLEDTFWNKALGYMGAHGSTLEEAGKNLQKLPFEERKEALRKFRDYIINGSNLPDFMRNDFNVYLLQTDFLDESYYSDGQIESTFKRYLFNAVGWLGALEVVTGGLAAIGTRPVKAGINTLLKAPAVTRLAFAQRPAHWQRALQRAFNEMPDAAVRRYFNLEKTDIAQTQLPSPRVDEEPIVNMPDGIATPREIDRLEQTTQAAMDAARRLEQNKFTAREQGLILNEVVEELAAANVGRLRLGMSELSLYDDMSGVEMRMMLGADENHGFKSLDEAISYVQNEVKFDPSKLEYFKVQPDGTLAPFKPSVERVGGVWKSKVPETGEFYVRAKMNHIFSPEDARLFDGAPVVHGAWQGRLLGILSTPSSFLEGSIVGKFVRSYLGEQAVTNQLDSIIAPLFKQYNPQQRLKINDAMLWAEKFGVDEGRMPSLDELREAFPKMSNDEWKGFYTARHFQDTLYGIQNARLYNNWNARGFVSVSKPGLNQAYHGKPVARGEVKVESFLDPETGKSVKLSSQELDDFYTNGGSVIKMDMSMQGSKGQAHYYVLVDSRQGWRSGALRKHVLEYIPGYNTRIYEDAHFIQRVKKNAIIDGKPQEHISTMRVASTQIEAEAFQKRVIDALGRKLYKDQWNKNWSIGRKHKALEEKGYDIVVSRDARLSDADRIQVDLSKLQTEGRLFFDNRQKKAIRNTDNQPADIVDPVNAVQRTARMVARQVSTEQLVSTQKQQFFSKYKDLKIREGDTSSEIDGFLTSLIKTGSKEESLRATKARAWWRYIRFMEGSMNAQPSMFRRAAIKVSEWVDFNIGGKLGNRELTREISRRMGNVSAVNSAKQLAFLHFLTARPLRQLVLQGMQHMNLQALDLSYVGKWQMDTFSLLGAMKRLSRAREDDILYGVKRTQMAKMMGYTDDEMEIIMREFSQSGLVDTVDVHSYAGGMPKTAIRTPRSRIGQGLNETWTNINKPVNAARAMGFDMGEQFNVTASWLMALRRTMKENGFKKITELDSQHWDDIANRGSQYALAMHKANAATWQYGLLSLPLQFLQFTHKWLLTSLGASKTMRKLGLANQAFTQEEALKIVAMQTVMWGGAGTAALFGLRDNLENVVNSFDPDGTKLGEDGRQLLLSGLADWALDQVVRGVMNDPDLGYAWDDIFSPAMGSQMLSEKILELGTEPFMLHEVLLGPSGQVFSRYQKAFAFGQALAGKDYEHWSAGQRAQGIIEAGAAGLFAGYSDLLKVRLAAKMGQWTNAAGVPLEVEAKWLDLVLKGGFGINPDRLQNYWNYVGKLGDLKADLKDNAREHAERVNYIVMQWSDKKLGDEDALAMLNTLATVYDLYKEDGLGEQYYEQMMAEYSRLRTPDGESILKRITELLMRGYTGDVVTDLLNSGNLTPQQADELREMLNRQMSLSEENLEKRLELFELEREIVRNTTDGRP